MFWSVNDLVDANAALDAWEDAQPEIPFPTKPG
jgi:hypothetical protein